MNQLEIEDLHHEMVQVTVADGTEGLDVHLLGRIDMKEPDRLLGPYFDRIHSGLVSRNVAQLHLHLETLTYLNSSGILALLRWVRNLRETKPNHRYRMYVYFNDAVTWQRVSIRTVERMSGGMIKSRKAKPPAPAL